jgi:hypothetical protein
LRSSSAVSSSFFVGVNRSAFTASRTLRICRSTLESSIRVWACSEPPRGSLTTWSVISVVYRRKIEKLTEALNKEEARAGGRGTHD